MLSRLKLPLTPDQAQRRPIYLLIVGCVCVLGWIFDLVFLDVIPLVHLVVQGTFGLLTVMTLLLARFPGTLPLFEWVVALVVNLGVMATVVIGLLDHPLTYDPLEFILVSPAVFIVNFTFLGVARGMWFSVLFLLTTTTLVAGYYQPRLAELTEHQTWAFESLQHFLVTSLFQVAGLFGLATFLEHQSRARFRAEATAQFAYQDPLTGLGNRRRFQESLEQALQQADRQHQCFGVLFIDLDHFKGVNDRHGHQAGDELLRQFAGRMVEQAGQLDTVYRVSGDEFAVLTRPLAETGQALSLAQQINRVLSEPYEVLGKTVHATASIGVSVYPQHGLTSRDLLGHADQAMYQSKSRGRNTFTLYSPDMATADA